MQFHLHFFLRGEHDAVVSVSKFGVCSVILRFVCAVGCPALLGSTADHSLLCWYLYDLNDRPACQCLLPALFLLARRVETDVEGLIKEEKTHILCPSLS